ncbi:MAG: hypothetical protein H8E35_10250 [Ardenticatenia bacterium]|nr:hypothetical protein [Ardenticatenia bacterium]
MEHNVRACEGEIEFSGMMGPGVIVEFGKPWRLNFWREACYIPCWELGNQWLTNEWFETGSTENRHCFEPMMDFQCRYSNVEILEEGPARAVVHWNYALCDNRYRIFNGNTTADEYYTVYPDGIAIRRLVGWPGNESSFGGNPTIWEVGEWIVVNPAGTVPEDTLKSPVLTLGSLAGDIVEMTWPHYCQGKRSFCDQFPDMANWQAYIGRVNFVDQPSPFAAFPNSQLLFPHVACSVCGKLHPEIRPFVGNQSDMHWPGYKRTDYVGWKRANDEVGKRPTTTSIASYGYGYGLEAFHGARTSAAYRRLIHPHRPTTWLSLQGVTAESDFDLLRRLVASWLNPADVVMATPPDQAVYEGYAFAQRAHEFRMLEGSSLEFEMVPTAATVNPVFILNRWPADTVEIMWGSRSVDQSDIVTQPESDDLVVWVKGNLTYPLRLKMSAK